MKADNFITEINKFSDPQIAEHSNRFFKTGPGHYGEGDEFIGVRVPQNRKICRAFKNLPLNETQRLLNSKVHEHRLAAMIILADQFSKSDDAKQQEIYEMYLANVHDYKINNWDIVDISAPKIIGAFLFNKDKQILYKLAGSNNLWERRVAIMATFYFIRNGEYKDTLELAFKLMQDKEDLIHKACGWMLREVGNRPDGKDKLINFLDKHVLKMPRTMLRYAIEKFPEKERQYYLKMK